MNYPKVITPKILEDSKFIPLDVLRTDIKDATAEIAQLERKIEAYEILAVPGTLKGKMAYFKLTGARIKLTKTEEQLAFIELLLAARLEELK